MVRGRCLFAFLVVSAPCALAYADESGSDAPQAKKAPIEPEEEKVAPTGLIIGGIALAGVAVLLLVGKRKKSGGQAPRSELAEVHLLIETDDRATVWTSQSALRLQTDRQGEVTLNLPIGRHDIHLLIGSDQYTRSVLVNRIERMRIPINIAKERIVRTRSGDFPAVSEPLASAGVYRPDSKALIADLPVPGKPPTSAARAYPDSSSQGKLGDQLAGLIDVELDNPAAPPPSAGVTFNPSSELSLDPGAHGNVGAIDFSELSQPQAPGLTLDLGDPHDGGVDFDVPLTPPPVAAPLPPSPRTRRESALGNLPARNRPPTSPLEGIVRETPAPARAPVLPKAPTAPPRPPMDISLDDIAPPQRSGKTIPPPTRDHREAPTPAGLLDELPMPPKKKPASLDFDALDDLGLARPAAAAPVAAGNYELAPPQAAPTRKAAASKVSVSDFALDELPVRPAAPVELPKVSAASVSDLSLDEDDVPVHRIPSAARTASNRKVPSVADFALDEMALELSSEPVSQAMPKAPPMVRAVTPISTSALDDILAPAGSLPVVATPTLAAPVTVALADRYRKGAPMGGGPLGQLFRGRDETGRRDVMIEEVPRDVALPVPAGALAQLTHANLVTFYDHVFDASRAYLITEVVEGKTLKQHLAERGSLSALEAIGIVDQVCAGLAAAHARNVFHRCVRPGCILMSGRTVKLTGFAWSPATRALLYTAPELAAGSPADARADLYSLGITLAELLSGTVPSGGKLELPSDVPRMLAQLVRKLVSREPTIRPTSAKAVREVFSSVF